MLNAAQYRLVADCLDLLESHVGAADVERALGHRLELFGGLTLEEQLLSDPVPVYQLLGTNLDWSATA